jgi:hypothetical protein
MLQGRRGWADPAGRWLVWLSATRNVNGLLVQRGCKNKSTLHCPEAEMWGESIPEKSASWVYDGEREFVPTLPFTIAPAPPARRSTMCDMNRTSQKCFGSIASRMAAD